MLCSTVSLDTFLNVDHLILFLLVGTTIHKIMNFNTSLYTMLCAFALFVLSVSAQIAQLDNNGLDFDKRGPYRAFAFAKRSDEQFEELEKRARYGFAKRSPYRTFAFAKRANPYGFAFAKRTPFSSFA